MSEMPNWQGFLIPVLRVMKDGVIRSRQEMRGPVADLMGLTAEQRKLLLTSGQLTYENRMGWALSYLSNVGALERTGRNRYRIMPGGHVVLQHFPKIATKAQLEKFAKDPSSPIHPYKRSDAEPSPNPPVIEPEPETLTPTEQVERGITRIQEDVASELLDRLQGKDPAFFEQAVVDLLLAMGYGGTNGRGQVTSLTNDGGIDGVIDQDVLGLSRVFVQAKRYASGNVVQSPEVQRFVGALSGKADGGVFITTSSFTPGAVQYAGGVPQRIILIDGKRLTDLMIRYGVGVQVRETYHVVEIDEDFFGMSRIDDLIAELCPKGVEFKPLDDVIMLRFGTRITKLKDSGTEYPVYGGGGESFRTDNYNREDDYVISRFAMSETCVRKVSGRFWMLDSGFTFEVKGAEILKDYVAQWLFNRQGEIYECSSQGAQKNLRTGEFRKFRIPVPPMEVQREIVRILDTFSALEAELEGELEAELEKRRIQHAHYRKQLLKFKSGFREASLDEVADFVNGKPHERLVSEHGTVALLTSRFISTEGKRARYVDRDSVLTPAKADDVALVMSDLPNGRALSKAFYVDADERYAANQRVCLLRVKSTDKILPRFLYHIIDRNPQLLAYDNGMDQTHLKKGQILGVRLLIPPREEQEEIVQVLDEFDALVNDLSVGLPAELAARRTQYEHYRDRLLTFEERV